MKVLFYWPGENGVNGPVNCMSNFLLGDSPTRKTSLLKNSFDNGKVWFSFVYVSLEIICGFRDIICLSLLSVVNSAYTPLLISSTMSKV